MYHEVQLRPGIRAGQMLVDTYAAQHPGVPGRQSSQSVAVHLMSLCAQLERGLQPEHATARMHAYLVDARGQRPTFAWLEPPPSLGATTVVDVHAAETADELNRLLATWARDVWTAWTPHHAPVRTWLDAASR
jgi:hypothetical protein